MNVAQALGYSADDRLFIVNADDYGLCHSTNTGIQKLLIDGVISSATLMMPCSWAREAALWSARHAHMDVGVHFTFTSEWDMMKWGPVNRHGAIDTLVTHEGYFPKDVKSFERQADPEQVRGELEAQVRMAITLGVGLTHADNHMGSLYGLQTGRHFLNETLDVCAKYGLPFRLPRNLLLENGQVAPAELAEQARKHAEAADAKGVVVLDYLLGLPFRSEGNDTFDMYKSQMIALLGNLHAGVSEIIIHPSFVTDELRAFHDAPARRGMELELFRDPDIQETIRKESLIPVRWRQLRDLQRGLMIP
ncbi:polysaccharide deacetylase family protein [Paenibacillus oenotherae]|uniref:Polysaccharide deacetylase family protein n=1 Tax=Paenibacillus oenotherae TaxID=1435645 RepID=A0ABS7DC68_9BACL|nr:polysaccharide deacetylase family protein [Paenibacillus oenotherae]MBW7477530.1 polysaccharide deacetylase family protein [Paenibacillus oenotherae]